MSLKDIGLCKQFESYDINPGDSSVVYRDTIRHFPKGFNVCITNPPWLAKNSATRRGIQYPATKYDDLYKHCISLCLQNCPYVAALIPASFLHADIFRDRLDTYVLLHDKNMFIDTNNPVCLALFSSKKNSDVKIYYDNEFIGNLSDLSKKIPVSEKKHQISFNDKNGDLGFISFDNTRSSSIRFCNVEEIDKYPVKISSRFFSRIRVDSNIAPIEQMNEILNDFRLNTKDLFLTPFKGIRKDGMYRRRMSFSMAKEIINAS